MALMCSCGSSNSTAAPAGSPTGSATVDATPSLVFSPSPASILPGGTITFAFGAVAHNVFFDAVSGVPADIPGNNAGASVTRTFPTAGTYPYSCHIHPGMRGVITVSTASSAPNGGSGYP
jgi:plastocyanin